jgi:uncharacterized protein (DUF3084 family)
MTKILLISCIFISLGAAVLGFLNRGRLLEARSEVDVVQSQLTLTDQQLEAARGELEAQKKEVSQLGGEKEKISAELGEARGERDKAKEELAAAQQQAKDLESDSQAKDTRIGELETQIAELEQSPTTSDGAPVAVESAEAQARMTELETVNQQLQDQNTSLSTQISELRRKEDGRQKVQMRQGLSGTILAVNQAWNFVVLSLGDRQGVVPNAEMLVQRDGQFLGKIRVTSVEPSTSIADILVRTVPRGLSVMPGDRVIYQALRD